MNQHKTTELYGLIVLMCR